MRFRTRKQSRWAFPDNEDVARNRVVASKRLRASLESIDLKYFIIGRAQTSIEVANQCGELSNTFESLAWEVLIRN